MIHHPVYSLLPAILQGSSHDNKSVENCVCILRNLSYRCQEVEDPNYDKNQPALPGGAAAPGTQTRAQSYPGKGKGRAW